MKKYPKIGIIDTTTNRIEDVFTVLDENIVPFEQYKNVVEERMSGELHNKGFYLPAIYDWAVVQDSDNQLVLIATHRLEKHMPIIEPITYSYPSEDENEF